MLSNTSRLLRYTFVFIIVVLFAGTGCVSTQKHIAQARKQESLCDLSRLGKNKYFYSSYYERKLSKSTKKLGGR
jgi:hypothetical protein